MGDTVAVENPQVVALRHLIKDGLTFGEAMHVFAEGNDDNAEAYISAAHEHLAEDGELEIDDSTIVSGSSNDGGDYVLAWVWVSFDQAFEGMEEPHPCDECGTVYDEAGGDGDAGICPECADKGIEAHA